MSLRQLSTDELFTYSCAMSQVPRQNRLCKLCVTGTMGDGKHLTFACPTLQAFRDYDRDDGNVSWVTTNKSLCLGFCQDVRKRT